MLAARSTVLRPAVVLRALHTTPAAARPQPRPPSDGSGPLFTTPFEVEMGYREPSKDGDKKKETGTDKMNKMKGGKSFKDLKKQREVGLRALALDMS